MSQDAATMTTALAPLAVLPGVVVLLIFKKRAGYFLMAGGLALVTVLAGALAVSSASSGPLTLNTVLLALCTIAAAMTTGVMLYAGWRFRLPSTGDVEA